MTFTPPTETNPPFTNPPTWPFPNRTSERWETDYRLSLLESAILYMWANGSPGTKLTYFSDHLTTPVILGTTLSTVFSTFSLSIGTWAINFTCLSFVGNNNTAIEITTVPATGTGVFLEGAYSAQSYGNGSAPYISLPLSFTAQVTTAQGLLFRGLATVTTPVSPTIMPTTTVDNYSNATGYTALKIA